MGNMDITTNFFKESKLMLLKFRMSKNNKERKEEKEGENKAGSKYK